MSVCDVVGAKIVVELEGFHCYCSFTMYLTIVGPTMQNFLALHPTVIISTWPSHCYATLVYLQ